MSFFGQNIRFLRNQRQLSQSAFAELFGLKRAAVGAYEEERAEPKVEVFVEIARYFGISMEDLVCSSLQDSGVKSSGDSVALVKESEYTKYVESLCGNSTFVTRHRVSVPMSIESNFVAFEYCGSVLIAKPIGVDVGLFDNRDAYKMLVVRRSGISIGVGATIGGGILKYFEIVYIIKCYENSDFSELMLSMISSRIERIENKIG